MPLTGKLILGATTNRRVLDSVEYHHWLVNVDAHNGAFVTLSNDNLASSPSSESAIHVTESGVWPISDDTETLASELASIREKFKQIENDFAAAQRNLAQFTPTPEAVMVSPAKAGEQPNLAGAKPTPPPMPQTITLIQPVSVRTPYGSITLQRGTKLPLIARDGSNVRVRYMDGDQVIPISATDLK